MKKILLGLVVLLAGIGLACEEADRDTSGMNEGEPLEGPVEAQVASRDGLRILTADDGLLRGSFGKGGEVVYFEARRGDKAPLFGTSPGFPEFEVDARFVDAVGRTIATQAGGHGLPEASWEQDSGLVDLASWEVAAGLRPMSFSMPQADGFDRLLPFLLIGELPESLPEDLGALDFSPEWDALHTLATYVSNEVTAVMHEAGLDLGFEAVNAGARPAPEGDIVPRALPAPFPNKPFCNDPAYKYHNAAVWAVPFSYYGVPSQHSGVGVMAACSKADHWPVFYYLGSSCNHGGCAGAEGMTLQCQKGWMPRTNPIKFTANHKETGKCQSGSMDCPGSCTTPFGGTPYQQHVCNDDSSFQYGQVRDDVWHDPMTYDDPYDGALYTGPTCKDFTPRNWSPACS